MSIKAKIINQKHQRVVIVDFINTEPGPGFCMNGMHVTVRVVGKMENISRLTCMLGQDYTVGQLRVAMCFRLDFSFGCSFNPELNDVTMGHMQYK